MTNNSLMFKPIPVLSIIRLTIPLYLTTPLYRDESRVK